MDGGKGGIHLALKNLEGKDFVGIINGLFIAFTANFSSSPNVFIGDPVLLKKSLDSRLEALRE
jgi:hypothetical protein